MPAPTTVPELIDLVQKSGVTESPRLTNYVQQLTEQNALPVEPNKFAGLLIRDGILTYFQAEQILQGKWKRFTIGKYKVLERLGSGGMGQVYLCEHKLMRRKVAVKVLPSAKAEKEQSLERFHREARAIAALDHPNLVRAFDIDQDEKLHFLVMEYVDGASLQELVKKSGPLQVTRACHYVYWTAIGLQYAFEVASLVHRDVKPGNIMVDRQGSVKLLDMGLARFFNDEQDNLTKKYDETVLGTADYLSPEQALDSHEVDVRADVYSLGATFYYLLTGHPPFPDGTVAQKLIWHKTRQPKPVRLIRPDVPEGIAAIIERMMMKDKAARFQTPAELAGALSPYVQTPIPPPADDELPKLCAAVGGTPAVANVAPPVSSGRWAIPPMPSTRPNGPKTPQPSRVPSVTPVGTESPAAGVAIRPKALTPRPMAPVAATAAVTPARRNSANPFANLLVAEARPAAAATHNVYATASTRAAALLPQAATDIAPTSVGKRRFNWLPIFGLLALATAGLVIWHFTFQP